MSTTNGTPHLDDIPALLAANTPEQLPPWWREVHREFAFQLGYMEAAMSAVLEHHHSADEDTLARALARTALTAAHTLEREV